MGSIITLYQNVNKSRAEDKMEAIYEEHIQTYIEKYSNTKHSTFIQYKWYKDNKANLVKDLKMDDGYSYEYQFPDGGILELGFGNTFRGVSITKYMQNRYKDDYLLRFVDYTNDLTTIQTGDSTLNKIMELYEKPITTEYVTIINGKSTFKDEPIDLGGISCRGTNMYYRNPIEGAQLSTMTIDC